MSPADDFWEFAVKAFKNEELAAGCITLQDTFGTDTNVILLHLWGQLNGTALQWEAVYELAEKWQAHKLRELREARRTLKPIGGELYAQIRRVEIMIERREQEALIDAFIDAGGTVDGEGSASLADYFTYKDVMHAEEQAEFYEGVLG